MWPGNYRRWYRLPRISIPGSNLQFVEIQVLTLYLGVSDKRGGRPGGATGYPYTDSGYRG